MRKIIVDASVIVKWFIAEKYSKEALELRKQFVDGQIELFAPDLLPYEVLNALKYSQLFQPKELEAAITAFEHYGIVQFPLNDNYARHVARIAGTYDISVYDAAYVGLLDVIDAKVYTADKRLVEKLDETYRGKIVYIPAMENRND
ncbi:MAG: type II toxin-antitoxin system VapC family toxin [Candidatus Ranarchaeia archaeon]